MRAIALIVTAILVSAACGSTVAQPSPTPTSAPTTAPPSTPTASPASRIVAFPDLTFIVGTNTGDLYFQIKDGQPAGRKVHVCGGAVRDLVAYGRRAAFFCGSGPGDPQTLYVYDDATGALTTVVKTESSRAAFTTTNGLVYIATGTTVPTAPIPSTKLMLLNLGTGTTVQIDERLGVAFDLWLTSGGVAIWRPQNSLSFVRPEAEAGTWLLNDKTLSRLSLHRLIDGFPGRYLLESEPVDSSGYRSSATTDRTYVVLRTDTETRLTPADVSNEKGVAVLPDGRIFTWRPQAGSSDGTMVVYQDGAVVHQDRGMFSTLRLLHTADWTTHTADWIIGYEISGAGPQYLYRAYRFSDGAFASIPAGSITTLGFLGPN